MVVEPAREPRCDRAVLELAHRILHAPSFAEQQNFRNATQQIFRNHHQSTFGYAATLWTDATVLNPASTALDMTEAKLASFSAVPFDAVRVGLVTGATNWLVIPVTAASLQALFSAAPTPTSLGVGAWRALVSSPSLEANCNLEGFNTQCTNGASSRVRIGIAANNQSDCTSCDSWIGVGGDGPCGQAEVGAGNVACVAGDNGDKNTRAFAYVMVR